VCCCLRACLLSQVSRMVCPASSWIGSLGLHASSSSSSGADVDSSPQSVDVGTHSDASLRFNVQLSDVHLWHGSILPRTGMCWSSR